MIGVHAALAQEVRFQEALQRDNTLLRARRAAQDRDEHLRTEREIVELTVLIATYNMHVRVVEALKIEPEI